MFTPLLSPAVTQHGSHYPSPQFNDTSQGMASTSSSGAGDQQTQLQAIQMQQLNIQRQLDDLQRQQSHTSHSSQSPQNQAINQSQQQPSMPRNSMPPHMMQQQQQQHQQQQQPQGNMHTYNPHESSPYVSPLVHARADDPNSNFPTPTSEFFSPLTSPALNPVNSYGARVGVVQHRQSSSAGSRVGPTRHGRLSEGMQQTISPALLPQIDGNMINVPGLHDGGNGGGNNDQFNSNSSGSGNGSHSNDNNLTEWVNFLGSSAEVIQTPPIDPSLESRNLANSPSIMMNPGTTNGGGHFSGINSPSHPFSRSTAQERTTNGRSPSLGPHRSTASGKTRPSPMIKPTHRQNRGSGKGHISVPESPLVAAFTSSSCSTTDNSSMANKGTFIDSGTANTNGSIGSGSLSPVELSAILMPPPPIPAHVHHQLQPGPPGQALAPMTPAALMQLGGGVQAPLTLNTLAHAHAQVKKTKSTASTPATSPHTSPPTSLVGRKPSLSSKNGMSKPAEIKPRAVKPKPTTATPATAEGMNVDSTESPSSVLTLQGLDRLKMSLAEMKKADRARLIKFGSKWHWKCGTYAAFFLGVNPTDLLPYQIFFIVFSFSFSFSIASTGSITPRAADMKLANGKGTAASASSTSKSSKKEEETTMPPEVRRSSHKAAEQKRRDSLKAGFDELRLLLPPINTEALDPESGEPIPGSSAPRLLPKSSLVPDDNPNKGVSKVALLKYSNEYIERLHAKVARRDNYIDLLKDAVVSFRNQVGFGVDEQVQELLDYQFEDEDEDEVPTGMMYPGGTAGGPKQANNDTTEDELVNLHVDGGGGGGGQWPTETEQPNDAEHQQQPPSQAQRPEKTGTGRRGSKSRPHQSNNTGSTSTVTNGNASRRKNLTSASTSTSTVVATQPSNSAASGTSSSRRNSKSKQNTVVVGDVEMA